MKIINLSLFSNLLFIDHTFGQTTEIPLEFTTHTEAVISRVTRGACRVLDLSMSSLFQDSSPCRISCNRANTKCRTCRRHHGISSKNCLNTHTQLLEKCERCMRNPHRLTQDEIQRIKVLNNLNYNVDLVGETVTTIPKVKFTLHDRNGKIVKDWKPKDSRRQEVKTEISPSENLQRILFGRTAQPKQIPWHVTFINNGELQCGGALVTANKIVSAAHCFDRNNFPTSTDKYKPVLEYLVARAGNVNTTRGEVGSQERKCSDIIIHS